VVIDTGEYRLQPFLGTPARRLGLLLLGNIPQDATQPLGLASPGWTQPSAVRDPEHPPIRPQHPKLFGVVALPSESVLPGLLHARAIVGVNESEKVLAGSQGAWAETQDSVGIPGLEDLVGGRVPLPCQQTRSFQRKLELFLLELERFLCVPRFRQCGSAGYAAFARTYSLWAGRLSVGRRVHLNSP
jgi:hypothetical protein